MENGGYKIRLPNRNKKGLQIEVFTYSSVVSNGFEPASKIFKIRPLSFLYRDGYKRI